MGGQGGPTDYPYLEMPSIGVLLGQQVQAGSRVVSELMLMPMNRGVTEVSAVSKAFFTLDTSGGNTASGFIDYNSLKESDITSWNDEFGVSISSQLACHSL